MDKIEALRGICRAKEKSCMLVGMQNNLAWLTGGRTHVGLNAVSGVGEIIITPKAAYLLAPNIELRRLLTEEISLPLEPAEYPWHLPQERARLLEELTGGDYITDAACEAEILPLRMVLEAAQQQQLVSLGTDCADAVTLCCQELQKGDSEYKIAGILARNCLEREIDPLVNLIAADQRILDYRHPIPTANTVSGTVMVVLGGRRHGLFCCLTRFVAFEAPTDKVLRHRDAVHNLEAMLREETRPGASLGTLFDRLVEGYGEQGYPGEWKLHHQGGPCGYNSREAKATSGSAIAVAQGQAYAWNPSITGYKAEDTFLVGERGNQVLTGTPELPVRAVQYGGKAFALPDFLRRNG